MIDTIPKLIIYGTLDWQTGAMFKNMRKEIEKSYSLSGNVIIKPMQGMSHFLNPKWQMDSPDGLKSDKVGKLILDFLESSFAAKYL